MDSRPAGLSKNGNDHIHLMVNLAGEDGRYNLDDSHAVSQAVRRFDQLYHSYGIIWDNQQETGPHQAFTQPETPKDDAKTR